MDETRLEQFVAFAQTLRGDEKSEAQTFLTRLFQAFGHAGAVEAGATFEHRIRIDRTTTFADLLWPGRVLIEMKSRGVNLDRVVPQAKAYWDNAYKDRTEYVVLCNFGGSGSPGAGKRRVRSHAVGRPTLASTTAISSAVRP